MNTRRHVLEEQFTVAPERMFKILVTPSAIREWWGASKVIVVPKPGGVWIASWGEDENDSDYITSYKITEIDPPRRMLLDDFKYYAKDGGPAFEANLTTEFAIDERHDGCSLRITQDGFPLDKKADEFFDACVIGWKNTFDCIRKYFFDHPR
jgi:uncharacterized protein YndB with AHSA1/START domain